MGTHIKLVNIWVAIRFVCSRICLSYMPGRLPFECEYSWKCCIILTPIICTVHVSSETRQQLYHIDMTLADCGKCRGLAVRSRTTNVRSQSVQQLDCWHVPEQCTYVYRSSP